MANKKEPTYSEAMAELEAIVASIEDEAIEVEHLAEKVRRARHLITFCKGRLRATEEDVRKVLDEIERETEGAREEAGGEEDGGDSESPGQPKTELF
jgi:exodeoxyribonuclease VII small subunit